MTQQIHLVVGADYDDYQIDSAWFDRERAETRRKELHALEFTTKGTRRVGATGLSWDVQDMDIEDAALPVETVVSGDIGGSGASVWHTLNRMYDGDVPTVKEDRTMWHYVNAVQEWTVMQTWPGRFNKTLFNGTREQADAFARKLRAENGGDVTIAEEW